MKEIALKYNVPNLSSNQIQERKNLFIILKNPIVNKWLIDKRLDTHDFESYVNPVILKFSKEEDYQWEYCASFPQFKANVKRSKFISVEYMNDDFKDKQIELSGFKARLFQHEMDLLRGQHIMNWGINLGEIEVLNQNYINLKQTIERYKPIIKETMINQDSSFQQKIREDNYEEVMKKSYHDPDQGLQDMKGNIFQLEKQFIQDLERAYFQDKTL